ncbi:MAG: FAD-dependent monooxygenase [Paludibacteraceae bacterium]|nr:FAD-dependent monooxygenase [Paludibacteraceae bacterium]
MENTKQYILSPKEAYEAAQRWRIVKRSVDARQRELKVHLTVLTDEEGHPINLSSPLPSKEGEKNSREREWRLYEEPVYQDVHEADRKAIIIGAGPAGLFAALTLLEHGIKPIIYERGKEVSARKRDIALLNRNEGLNPESNYCFGEGGAGTFSDGKLFSRSKKRGNMQRVMEIFHYFGAADTVLYEAHAHIGSDKLPGIIKRMRECIIEHGGEIYFETKIESLKELKIKNYELRIETPIILAIGHSAHDTYRMLAAEGVALEAKGFAMGVRAEHPQAIINRLMYHLGKPHLTSPQGRNTPLEGEMEGVIKYVGNASYSLVTQVDGRGVYSFCMCPGGHIVPAGSSADSCVVNGMSASHRNSPYANSGMVVQINPEDLPGDDPLRGLEYQEALEREAFMQSHNLSPTLPEREEQRIMASAVAPAQRMRDFVEGRASKDLPPCSYLPGIIPSRLDLWLPPFIGKRLQQGFRDFDKKYPGFLTNDAVIVGVESRSSSAVRIPRDPETLESINTPGLYPCGEGAGYAGGITSSALDGINAALKIAGKH